MGGGGGVGGGDVTSSLQVTYANIALRNGVHKAQGLAFLTYPARICRDTQGPWQISSPNSYCALVLFKHWGGHIDNPINYNINLPHLLLFVPYSYLSEAN